MTFYTPLQNLNMDFSNSFTFQTGAEKFAGGGVTGGFYSSIFDNNFSMPAFNNPFMFNMPSFNFSWMPFNFQMPTFNFTMPSFDFGNFNIFSNSTYSFNTQSTRTGSSLRVKYTGDNIPGYNAAAGKKLANTAYNRAPKKFTEKCATYVKQAIDHAGMGEYKSGHGYQMTQVLAGNKNFKQIPVDNVDYKKLPAGCVLVYGKGVEDYSPDYGHTEITLGDGRAVSDGITNRIRKPSAIFIPV